MKRLLFMAVLLFLSTFSFAQQVKISGTVKNNTGEPLPGISITEQGKSNVVQTDENGHFSISAAPQATLIVSGAGFISQKIKATAGQDMTIVLETNVQALEEVAVVGYSVKKKSQISSAVTTVSAAKLNDVTSSNIGVLLQGKAPGVVASSGSGDPTSGATIVVRGQGTLSASTDPLVVVDGNIGGVYNPNDVESVTILRDAAATGLYGSRAANGVMIITTKSGKAGKTKIDAQVVQGFANATTGKFKMMDAQQLYDYQSSFFTPDPNTLKNNTNWWDIAFRTAQVKNYYVSASGGSEKTQFYVAGGYYQEQGTLIDNNNNRYNFRANMTSKLTSRVKLNTNIVGTFVQDTYNSANTVYDAYLNLPYDPAYNADGTPVDAREGTWYGRDRDNPLLDLRYNYSKARSFTTAADLNLEYNIIKNLTFLTYNRVILAGYRSNSYYDVRSKMGNTNGGEGYMNNSFSSTLLSSNRLRYNKTFGDHSVTALAVAEVEQGNIDNNGASAKGFPPGRDAMSTATGVINLPTGGYDKYIFSKYLGQIDYSYNNKYFAVASLVNEYSSKFGKENPAATFYQFGASWIISNENFWNKSNAFNFLKLRGSYGTTGNASWDNYGYYVALGLYDITAGSSYAGLPGAAPSQKANPKITWEKVKTANIGVDMRLFNRIDFVVDVYEKRTSSLLYYRLLSALTGYSGMFDNVGELRNRGVEFNLTADVIKNKNFTWEMNYNMSFNRNKVIALDGNSLFVNSGNTQPVGLGHDMNEWFMQKWAGVDPQTGAPLWEHIEKGANGNDVVTTTTNYNDATRTFTGKSGTPKFTGGFSNNLSYKGFTLNIFFNFVNGNYVYNDSRFYFDNDGLYESYNQMVPAKGWTRWEKPGDIATHPKTVFGRSDASNATSTRYLEDGSYLRLRNITLGYNLPESFLNRLNIDKLRFFVSGDNLWTSTKFSGPDPEVNLKNGNSSILYPISRKILFGVNVSF